MQLRGIFCNKSSMMIKAVIFTSIIYLCYGAVMHSHTPHLNKERESDGAYSPRDKDHYTDSHEHNVDFDHEAIIGSYKEADEFDHLTPEESKKRLLLLLGKMDLNGDKFVDRKELKAWIIRSFKMLSEEEAKERLEDADENSDGIVTWEEYAADTYGMDESEETLSTENEVLMNDDRIMWKAADVNNDGVLTGDEWVAFSHPEDHPSMLPFILEQTLRDKDTDKDGAISFQEYVGERGRDHDKDWLLVEKDKFDRDMDRDGDGKLSGNEILSWVVPSNEEVAEEEVSHLFASADEDQDDVLSFNEIIENYDVFVGSEATDYGDQLHKMNHFEDEL